MECSSKPSSSILDFVSKFARVCRLRSVGMFSSENPKANIVPSIPEECSDGNEEMELGGEKIHPQPTKVLVKSNQFDDIGIQKIFETVSALKVAYVQLQNAHIPHEPEKIRAADDLVVDCLRVLCKMKRVYKEKRYRMVKFESKRSMLFLSEIQTHEKLLVKLKSLAETKDSDILCLHRELQELNKKNEVIYEKLKEKSLEKSNVMLNLSIRDVAKEVSKSIHDFAKPLISFIKASGWDLNLAANAIEQSVVYSQRSHKKYAFEAYIARRMFYGISLQAYDVVDIMSCDDPIDALIEDPTSCFAKFCQKKFPLVIHPKMEASFFGNLDHRTLVCNGKHPRTLFYQAFVKMAKWIWVLQGITRSIDPKAEIFQIKPGTEFSHTCMECVVNQDNKTGLKVAYTVLPGFRLGETLVKSRVYAY